MSSSFDPSRVTAVLGPTNTGKTHLAIERMLAHRTGMIGFPLRLLAREVYDRVVQVRGPRSVALITGEEKIIPRDPRYWICTVEAMPMGRLVEFMAVDEIQLIADPERGHVFTHRLFHARGEIETMFLGAATARGLIKRFLPHVRFVGRERLSRLSYAGSKKVSRLPRRCAIVTFSADSVYALAELIRRQRGGAAVVMGALSPRTRNAQVALYQSGDVDFLVATDAIGLGLNLDIDHVAFAASRKFDGRYPRDLTPNELAQIAGRAGRHMNDGTFGVTSECPPFDEETIERIEDNDFDPLIRAQWRNSDLQFASAPALLQSLERHPEQRGLVRTRAAVDVETLRCLLASPDVSEIAKGGAALKKLWEACQIPDFRKSSIDVHARLLGEIYLQLMGPEALIGEDWLSAHVGRLDHTEGDVDTLSHRIAHIRTWTFISNRAHWLSRASYWQGRTRDIEDRLSDALHDRLMQRFVDRRTSVLMRRLRDDDPILAGVANNGEVVVEGEFVGRLLGFQFIADPRAKGAQGKALRAAAYRALRPEIAARAGRLIAAKDDDFTLRDGGLIWWRDAAVGKLGKGPAALRPEITLVGQDLITPAMRPRLHDRLEAFVASRIETTLDPLLHLQRAVTRVGDGAVEGLARGLGYRLVEGFGALPRDEIAEDVRALDQSERGKLRTLGVRFGEYSVFIPALLKPAPARLLMLLRALHDGVEPNAFEPPAAGLTSVAVNADWPLAMYYAAGFRPSGARAVRIDMIERLAQIIRTAREASGRQGFEATPQMMSLVGCSGEEFETVLDSLGYEKHTIKLPVEEKKPKPESDDDTAKGKTEEAKPEAANQETRPDDAQTSEADATETAAPTAETSETEAAPGDAPSEETQAEPETPLESAETPVGNDTTAPTADSGAEAAVSPLAAVEAALSETTETPSEAGADEPAPEETESTATDTPPTEENADEPKMRDAVVWRPKARAHRQKQHARRAEGAKREGRRGKAKQTPKTVQIPPAGGAGRRSGPARNAKPKPRRADPDSPFAVLQALKDALGDAPGQGGNAKGDNKSGPKGDS